MLVHLLLVLMVCVVTSSGMPPVSVVDLTHQLGDNTLFWPGQPPFNFTILHRGQRRNSPGTWLESNYIALAEHGGTHIDAPAHFAHGNWRTHQIPPSRLVGPGVIVDVRAKVKATGADYAVTVDDLLEWEERHGRIPEGAVVIVHTGWGQYYPDRRLTFNSRTPQDLTTFHFPGFGEDAAQFLVDNRSVVAVGTDAPSPDLGISSYTTPVHNLLLGRNIVLLEYVANLERLPSSGATIVIGVINLIDGSGGPARIMGLLEVEASGSAGLEMPGWHLPCLFMALLATVVLKRL